MNTLPNSRYLITRSTIWRWAKSGKFNPQYIGREALIPKWEVDLFLESQDRNEVN